MNKIDSDNVLSKNSCELLCCGDYVWQHGEDQEVGEGRRDDDDDDGQDSSWRKILELGLDIKLSD